MYHWMNRKVLVAVGALCLFLVPALLQAQAPAADRVLKPAAGRYDLGLVFNTGNILLGPESYLGGFGGKAGFGDLAVRGTFDFVLNGASQSFAVNLGAALEKHFLEGPISPYFGGAVEAGYMRQAATTGVFPLSIGALVGVEVFVFDFLSVFVEYTLAADLTLTTDLATSTTTFDYLIDARMGNDAKLGIVVYLQRAEPGKKEPPKPKK
jgi:hypothetical protein